MKTKKTQSIKPKPKTKTQTQSIKTKRGGAFLGKGEYGCVFYPTIKCNENANSSNDNVSKVFKDKVSMREEKKEMEKLQRIPDLKPYINPVIKTCSVSLDNLKDKDNQWNKCPLFNSSNSDTQELHQLIYQHKGTSLDTYLQTAQIDANFFNGYLHLLKGAKVLKDNKIMHRDVKLPNLLKIQDSEFIFIDFGLSCNYTSAFNLKEFHWLLNYNYFIYPPEFKLVTLVYKNIKVFHNKKDKTPLDNFLNDNEWKKGYNCIQAELKNVFGNDDIMNIKHTEFQTYCNNLYTEISGNFIQFLEKANCKEPWCTIMYPQIIKTFSENCKEQIDIKKVQNAMNTINTSLIESLRGWNDEQIHDIVKNYFENTCAEKVDVFSLGISLLEAVNSSFNKLENEVQTKLKALIQGAIHFDPTQRITIEKMIEEMKSIVESFPKKNSPAKPNAPQKTQRRNTTNNTSIQTEQDQNMKNCLDKYRCVELRTFARNMNENTTIEENGKSRQMNKNELCNLLKDRLADRSDQPNVKGCYRRPNETKLENCMKYKCEELRKITQENNLAIKGENGRLLTKAQLCNQLLNQNCEIKLPDKGNGNAVQKNVLERINANTNACPA
jgi:serine/threonine protein kinase